MRKPSIIIVGGGITGLICAIELASKYSVIILEANNRLGGRIHSFKPAGFDALIEAGAEFIHGEAEQTRLLLKKAGIEPIPFKGKMYRREKGEWVEEEDMFEHWDDLLKKMKALKQDQTLAEFLEENYHGSHYDDLRRHVSAFAEGFDIADTQKVSVKSLYKEWSAGEEKNDWLPNGYGELIDFLEKECRKNKVDIRLNTVVKQVDWEEDDVTVYSDKEEKLSANKIIITLPVSILQQAGGKASINFTPPLDEQVKAAAKIGTGMVIKAVFQFKEPAWPVDTGFIFSDEIFPTWWPGINEKSHILTGWCGGPRAERIKNDDDQQLLEKAYLSLANILSLSIQEIKERVSAYIIFNWISHDWSNGGYSYMMPGSEKAIELLNQPIKDTVYFAGEALNYGNSIGTVEAAISSALAKVKIVNGEQA